MKVGIDGDVLLYQSAFAVQVRGYIAYDTDNKPIFFSKFKKDVKGFPSFVPYNAVELEDISFAKNIFDTKVASIIRRTGATSYTIYLTGEGNFRHKLYDGYKASRGDKPLLYREIRQHALGMLNTVVVDGQEADDALSIAQYKDPVGHIIASIDKDLLMVPGHHYNFNKDVTSYITPEEGTRRFYKQILTGDSVDDIPGIKGVGDKAAEKILGDITDEKELWLTIVNRWCEYLQHDSVLDTVINYARLLWMREYDGQMWEPPCDLRG